MTEDPARATLPPTQMSATTPSREEPPPTESPWEDVRLRALLADRIETFWNRDQFEAFVAPRLGVDVGGTVLDVGCGPGGLTIPLARALPAATVVGIDLDEGALEQARSLAVTAGVTNVSFRVGDATALPVADGEADATTCQTLLTHVVDAVAVLREMIRATRPGGAILAVEYDERGTFARADDVSPALTIEERVWRFEMALRYAEGKRLLGHGDERIGSRVPLLLQDLGCTVEDVRLVDRAWRALPPYLDPRERMGLETMRALLAPPSEAAWSWSESCYRAGGADDREIDRLRLLLDGDPWRSDVLALLDRGGYRYVSANLRFATLARTPAA